MKKRISIQDITPPERHRSIQDISMADLGREGPESRKAVKEIETKKSKKVGVEHSARKHVHVELPEEEKHFDFHSEYVSHTSKPRLRRVGIWCAIIILFLAGFAFASSFFYSAVVDIKVKEAVAEIDTDVKMAREVEAGALPFEVMSLSKEASENVPALEEKEVSTKAIGKIIVYNKNTVSQKLLSQTRFEAPNGKIYRLGNAVTVAGAKKSGATLVPGSLEVSVTADAPGPSYNSSLVDLTIPGFKGTAKYQTVYARSKTPFSGGQSGIVKIASKEDLLKAQESVKSSLDNEFLSTSNQQIPNSFILIPDVYTIRYSSSTQETKDDVLTLKQKADFVGVLVDLKKISEFLAKKSIPGYSGEEIVIDNINELTFEYSAGATGLNVNTQNISVKIKGKPHFVYGYDAEKLKADLTGLSRESFATVIATYPGLEKGNSKINPFWRSKFPQDAIKITINEEK